MEIRQHGDNFGGFSPLGFGGYGAGTNYSSACSLGIGGLVLLFIFLAIVGWAIHNGHDRTRDGINSGNALLLANRNDNTALAIAFARNEGRSDAIQAAILNRVDLNGERLCGLARQGDDNTSRIINHGETWGFQSFSRERCHCNNDRDERRGGNTVIDFNTGVQTGLALGNRGLTTQLGPLTGGGSVTGA